MYPVLLSVGPIHLASFGLFLAVAIFSAVFVTWRLSKAYDIDEAKIFDAGLATFSGGFIAARLYAVAFNREIYDSLEKIILVNRYPGLSFWGGFLGGTLALWLFSRQSKIHFWQIADFAAVGVLLGLVFGDFGCFLGGCAYGAVSNLPFAFPVVGLLGKRLPVSLFEAVIFLIFFSYLWKQAIKFHFSGKIVSVFLLFLGLVKFLTEFFRGDSRQLLGSSWVTFGHLLSVMVFSFGIAVFYAKSKRNVLVDLANIFHLLSRPKGRNLILSSWEKSWYNYKTAWKAGFSRKAFTLRALPKKLKRRMNVKSTPPDVN